MKMDAGADGIPADVVGRVLHFHSTASYFSPQNWLCDHRHHDEYDEEENGDGIMVEIDFIVNTNNDASIGVLIPLEELCKILLDRGSWCSSSRLAPGGSRWLGARSR